MEHDLIVRAGAKVEGTRHNVVDQVDRVITRTGVNGQDTRVSLVNVNGVVTVTTINDRACGKVVSVDCSVPVLPPVEITKVVLGSSAVTVSLPEPV